MFHLTSKESLMDYAQGERSRWDHWKRSLTTKEVKALAEYQDFGYIGTNAGLEKGTLAIHSPELAALDKAISSGRVTGPTTLYRTSTLKELSKTAETAEDLIGSSLVRKGYTSTSLAPAGAIGFGEVMLAISIPNFIHAAFVGAAITEVEDGADDLTYELEMLLPRNMVIRFHTLKAFDMKFENRRRQLPLIECSIESAA